MQSQHTVKSEMKITQLDLDGLRRDQLLSKLIATIAIGDAKDFDSMCIKKEFPAITNSNLSAAKVFFLELKSLTKSKPNLKKALEGSFHVGLYDYIPGRMDDEDYWSFSEHDTFYDNFIMYQALRNAPDEFIQFLAEEFPEYAEKALQSLEKFLQKYPHYKTEKVLHNLAKNLEKFLLKYNHELELPYAWLSLEKFLQKYPHFEKEFPEYTEKELRSLDTFLQKHPHSKYAAQDAMFLTKYPHYQDGFDYEHARLKILINCSQILADNMGYFASGSRKKDLITYYQKEISQAENEAKVIEALKKMESSILINAKRLPSYDKLRKEIKPTQSSFMLIGAGSDKILTFINNRERKIVVADSKSQIEKLLLEERVVEEYIQRLSSGGEILKKLGPAIGDLNNKAQLKERYLAPELSVPSAPPGGPDPHSVDQTPSAPPPPLVYPDLGEQAPSKRP